MKFLLDQDVYAVTGRFLSSLGHDVVYASELGLSRADDSALLVSAREKDRILVTRDRDFGGLVFVRGVGAGILYLRVLPSTIQAVHDELKIVLGRYQESELKTAFVVIEPYRHRFRHLGD